jgi:hypothetical protein
MSLSIVTRIAFAVIVAASELRSQGKGAPARQMRMRDSAGVHIIEHDAAGVDRSAGRLIASVPKQLGGLQKDESHELNARHPFVVPARLSTGVIVVSDHSSLKFYDASGAFIRSVGRKGSGPGEFSQLRRVCRLPGDTILAMGYSDRRMSLWSSDGKLIREFTLQGHGVRQPCFPDGTLLVSKPERGGSPSERGVAPHNRIRLDGSIVSELGKLPVEEYGSRVFRPVSIAAQHDRIVVADAKTFEVRVLATDGRLRRILRLVGKPAATDGNGVGVPEYGEVLVDPQGRIWVQTYQSPGRWVIFGADDSLLGSLRLPSVDGVPMSLVAFDAKDAVLRHADREGAPVLRWYRFEPRK